MLRLALVGLTLHQIGIFQPMFEAGVEKVLGASLPDTRISKGRRRDCWSSGRADNSSIPFIQDDRCIEMYPESEMLLLC